MPESLSICILTLNEERHLGRLLSQLAAMDVQSEILVLDSGSTDATVAIAEAHGARVLTNAFTDFAAQRNAAIDAASGDWILMIDADELLSDELKTQLCGGRLFSDQGIDAYDIPRRNYLFGEWLRFTYPDLQRRVFRRSARYLRSVHEKLDVPDTRTNTLEAHFDHKPETGLTGALDKLNRYTELERDEEPLPRSGAATYLRLLLLPPLAFVRSYLFRCGIRDGMQGLTWSGFNAMYVFVLIAKRIEHARASKGRNRDEAP